jgi:hypothetical protein
MMSARVVLMAAGAAISIAAPAPLRQAHAAPPREALVIGNGTYAALPALSACLPSAHAVAAALRKAGFNVVEREDVTSGGLDAAIAEAGRQLAANPGAPAFVYVCSYAVAFNGRPFLLPISANVARPADVLTQGLLAKSLVDLLTRAGDRPALLALDVVPAPNGPVPDSSATGASAASTSAIAPTGLATILGLNSLVPANPPAGLGYIAASQGAPADGPTPLAVALTANLEAATVEVAPLLASVRQQLGGSKTVTIAALQPPAAAAMLIGAPAPPQPLTRQTAIPPTSTAAIPLTSTAAIPPTSTAAIPLTSTAAIPPTSTAAIPPTPTTAASSQAMRLPAEDAMTDIERRRVQTALAGLGYYDGQIDGVFGPETRAAMRRYQHELGAEMTGQLTGDQASKLVAGR